MKGRIRGLLAASIVATMLFAFAPGNAADCGEGGSAANSSGSCETADNQVKCGDGTATPLGVVSAGENGGELCNDGSAVTPLQGRVGAEGPDCDCIYADGDADNMEPVDGWARIDVNGLACDVEGSGPSYNSDEGGACG